MKIKLWITGILASIAFIFSGLFVGEPLGAPSLDTLHKLETAQEAHKNATGRYLQILKNNRLPSYETGSVRNKLGNTIPTNWEVQVYDEPESRGSTHGYYIMHSDDEGEYWYDPKGIWNRTVLYPKATSTSFLEPFLSWITPLAFAGHGDNTHSTTLEEDNSQYWNITSGNQSGLNPSGDITISAWVKLQSQPGSEEQFGIMEKDCTGGCSGNSNIYRFSYYNNSGTKRFVLSTFDGTGACADLPAATLNNDTIYHVVMTWDASASDLRAFIDAVEVTTDESCSITSLATTATTFAIGAFNDPGSYMDGIMDEVLFYDAELSDSAISDLFTDPCNPLTTDLIGHWHFEDNDGLDETSNNNDLTAQGSADDNTATPLFTCAAAADGGYHDVQVISKI